MWLFYLGVIVLTCGLLTCRADIAQFNFLRMNFKASTGDRKKGKKHSGGTKISLG